MRIVFMGTPAFSVPCLNRLLADGHEVAGVFTQPDRPKGRGNRLAPPPVKEFALQHGLSVYQPERLRGSDAAQQLAALAPDLIIVVAYGQILPQSVLDLPRYGCINIHASLLPRYRGAAPIQWCILNGESKSGVTSMQMDAGLDTGDMLLRAEVPIGENETAQELHDALSVLGADVMSKTIRLLEQGRLQPEKQDDALSNYAPMLTKALCAIDWSRPAQQIHNQVRGLSGWPCASTMLGGRVLKIHQTVLCGETPGKCGEVVNSGGELRVACGDGNGVRICVLQAQGKKAMPAADFLRGNPVPAGTILE